MNITIDANELIDYKEKLKKYYIDKIFIFKELVAKECQRDVVLLDRMRRIVRETELKEKEFDEQNPIPNIFPNA